MIPFALPTKVRQATLAPPPPVTPAAYLRLRRKAAGLSVDAVALRMAIAFRLGDDDRAETAALLKGLETDGITARRRDTVEAFAGIFALDVDVYFQLRDAPVDQHPQICRGCGCSEWDPCTGADGTHSCSWAGLGTCSRCTDTSSVPVHQ